MSVTVICIMGVSGSGKTTIATRLVDNYIAKDRNPVFIEGDDLHPPENRQKMSSNIPLTDEDRWPWLKNLRDSIAFHIEASSSNNNIVVCFTCSLLKRSYREYLFLPTSSTTATTSTTSDDNNNNIKKVTKKVILVYLHGSYGAIEERMQRRASTHFMKPEMLQSQFETLQEPSENEMNELSSGDAQQQVEVKLLKFDVGALGVDEICQEVLEKVL